MTKKKSAKRAFLSSLLMLSLCFTMLVGTTFAWYTDSVTSSGNKIIAGTLDIQLWKYDGTNYVDISNSTAPIFQSANLAQNNTETLWEPGKTQIAYLKIKNGGNLWLKYQVALRVNNVTKNLDRAMLFKIVEAEAPNGVTAWDATGASSVAANTTTPAVLGPDEVYNFALVIHMDENAGNEYMGGEIDFDITVLATQYTKEEDSFGPNYDANAADGIATAYATYSASDDTVLETGDTNEVGNAKVTIPATAATGLADGAGVNLLVVETETPANFEVETESNGTTTYEVSLEDNNGAAITSTGDAFIVELNIGVVDLQRFVHNGVEMTEANGELDNNEYVYNQSTGIITFKTTSFSPFTSEYLFDGGLGTVEYPYLIADRVQFEGISDVETYSYYEWVGANEVDASNWTNGVYLVGSFDGKGVTFNNLDNTLFKGVWNGTESGHPAVDTENTYTIKNLTVNAHIVSAGWVSGVLRNAGVHNFVMENVTVHGYIEGATGVASFVCFGPGNYATVEENYSYDGNITFKNCNSDATIIAKSGNAVGFISHAMTATSAATIKLENSNFTGELSATSLSACKYLCGNWLNATATDDQKDSKNNTIYRASNNGWTYIAEGKIGSFSVEQAAVPSNIGDAFVLNAKPNAATAVVALVVSPNPGNMTSTYISEEISVENGVFTSDKVKYYQIRVNASGISEGGVHGDYYDIVYPDFNGALGSNTIVRVTQYASNGNIVGITEFNFHDVK